ncbi:MAG TPA: HAD family hydrolase [Solirubrobacterales bacterium]|nr:HAD family hydrolase [Solirubrobacterales bacterium]
MTYKRPAAISFDFWHTLVAEPDGLLAALRRKAVLCALTEHAVDVEAGVLDVHLTTVQALQSEAWKRGECFDPIRAATHLADAIGGLEGDCHDHVVNAYLGAGAEAELELSPEAAWTLEALDGDGVKLGITCDVGLTGAEHLRAVLERAGVLRLFCGWAFSDEVGHYKPSPEIFRHMLDQFELGEKDVVWHVGDLKRTDVAGARGCGCVPIRYRGLVDDSSEEPEADLIIESLAELVTLVRARS